MPTYDYRCKSCEHQFTRMTKMDDRDVPTTEPCPECGKLEVFKCINAVSFSYSGTGARTTDHFNDRLKEMKKRAGKGNTLSDHIR